MARGRRCINDLALRAPRLERGRSGLNAPHDAIDVDPKDALQVFGKDVGKRLHLRDTRIVDDRVEATKSLLDLLYRPKYLIASADVGDH